MYFAHSPKPVEEIPAQTYKDHVENVVRLACEYAAETEAYSTKKTGLLTDVVGRAAEFHDLGKLDEDNQAVLSGRVQGRLPVQHTDAGTASLLRQNEILAAALVTSHHIGLPDIPHEKNRGDSFFRDENPETRQRVDQTLTKLSEIHSSQVGSSVIKSDAVIENESPSVFMRLALSCLADADHTDTSIHYRQYPVKESSLKLKPLKRLAALDRYVSGLPANDDERSLLRAEMYGMCRNSDTESAIVTCDSPVGSGKTTAVMAYLLKQASKHNLRRIIVVLPFTSIIEQSAEIYRKALTLEGENPRDAVSEIHHKADFQDKMSRQYTALWKAPVIVTTAVAFFETLASNTPSTLRRLHNLPGSAVFVDESHAALPVKLLPLAWSWIKIFASEWNCRWVLASGSLNRFWEIEEFDEKPPFVPEILPEEIKNRLSVFESGRVSYRFLKQAQTASELTQWLKNLKGPVIVIANTVQNAAVLAMEYSARYGKNSAEHLSTALTPSDREKTLKRVKLRLCDHDDTDWVLFATSCVEAGVDISFRTGVRELSSTVSLLQTAGRVNRHGFFEDSEVWTVTLAESGLLRKHPGLAESSSVLKQYFDKETDITPSLCTHAMVKEVRLLGHNLSILSESENNLKFKEVEKLFRIIDSDTKTVVADKTLIEKLENNQYTDWTDIQKGSVQIRAYKLRQLNMTEITGRPGLFVWKLGYDSFIGYMSGLLDYEKLCEDGAMII
jgi:CRISPR/Cas system-associated endonuclease/helicase Cas3